VGAGTSGRIAALDAAELPPTFNADPETVQFVIAGGLSQLCCRAEANEDSRELGDVKIAKKKTEPERCRRRNRPPVDAPRHGSRPQLCAQEGRKTIAITCNRNFPAAKGRSPAIVTEVGPEVIRDQPDEAGTSRKWS